MAIMKLGAKKRFGLVFWLRLRGDNYDGGLTAICCILERNWSSFQTLSMVGWLTKDHNDPPLVTLCYISSFMLPMVAGIFFFPRHGFIGKRGLCQHLRRQFPKEHLPERGLLALQPGFSGSFKFLQVWMVAVPNRGCRKRPWSLS